jgi:hypothetical protein
VANCAKTAMKPARTAVSVDRTTYRISKRSFVGALFFVC